MDDGVDLGRLASREGPIACVLTPLSADGKALGLDVSGADGGALAHRAGPGPRRR